MKKIILILLVCITTKIKAQDIEVGLSAGTGQIYIIENFNRDINIDYNYPIVFSADIKYTPINSFFGLKVKYQSINGELKGDNWQKINSTAIFIDKFDGYIENRTIIGLLEYVNKNNNLGYNFGIGQTTEKINLDRTGLNYKESDFMVISLGGLLKIPLNSKISLKLEPSFQWNDPINTLYPNRYRMAGEDINFIIQFGLNYKLK